MVRGRGSGCGTVGREVSSNTRDPWFESSNAQLLLNILLLTVGRKDEKEAGNGPLKNLVMGKYHCAAELLFD